MKPIDYSKLRKDPASSRFFVGPPPEATARRIARLQWWRIALGAALVVSITGHTCDNVRSQRAIDRLRAQCVERAP